MVARRIPSLNWLRVFEAAARLESFARAAEALGMSAPAVSQQIRALEQHLGRALFTRHAKQVTLTAEGRAFLPSVHHALAEVETAAAAVFGPEERETVVLQSITLLAMSWLPKQIAAFEADHPHVRIDVTTADMITDRPRREPDLIIGFGTAAEFPENAVELLAETLFPVASAEIAQTIHELDDVLNHRLFEVAPHQSGWHQLLLELGDTDWRELQLVLADHTPLALMMAAQGLGLALARAPASDEIVSALGLVRCERLPSLQGNEHYYLTRPAQTRAKRGTMTFHRWLLDKSGVR